MDARQALLDAFGLEPTDLEANRRGVLSERQKRTIRSSGVFGLGAAAVVGLGLGAILLFVANQPLQPVQWILSLLFFLAVGVASIVTLWKGRASARAGRVECLTGPIQVRLIPRQGWRLDVAGRTFRLPVRFWKVQTNGTYRVYIAPIIDRIVAMEPEP